MEAFLKEHRDRRLALLRKLPPEKGPSLKGFPRKSRLFGDPRHEPVRAEPVFRGDLEADLVAATAAPVNFARVGG